MGYIVKFPGINSTTEPFFPVLNSTMENGWMDDLRFYILFNSISVISGRLADDNERLCAMAPRLRLRRFRHERGSNPGPLDQ